MIESTGQPFALVDGQIELERVFRARRWIRPHGIVDHRTVTGVGRDARCRQHPRGAVEKPRQLGKRNRPLIVEFARRMPVTQELGDRRHCRRSRRGEFAQVDRLAGPAGPHRRQRRDGVHIGINAAQRVGVPAFRAARVEQQIVKVPENEIVVALVRSKPGAAGGADLEEDLAIHQQSEELQSGKIFLPTQLLDGLRCSEEADCRRDARIANSKQCARARQFQHQLAAAPAHIGKSRQHDNVGFAEPWRLRPIIGKLRFDDDLVLVVLRAREAVLQQAVPGQSPDQQIDLFVAVSVAGRERRQRQTLAQVLHALARRRR